MYHTYIYFLTHICKVFLNILLVYYISYYLSIYYVGFFYILSLVKHSSSSGISSFLFLLLLRAFPIPRVVDRIEKTLKRDNLQSFEISKFFNIPQKFQKKSYLFFSWNLAFRFLHQQFSNKFIDILLRLSQKFKLTSRARKRGTMSDSYRCYRTPERWWTLPLIRLSVESRYERSYRIKVIMEGERVKPGPDTLHVFHPRDVRIVCPQIPLFFCLTWEPFSFASQSLSSFLLLPPHLLLLSIFTYIVQRSNG